ncbi:MAG: ParB/RepB/Spo0J family partition protein, partial [Syntrophales bacterium]|nr:ParB/RepB/Spo0J family partition protein [Syntrophales bacterium]
MDSSEIPQTDVVYEKGKLYQISLNDLLADPNQPRKVMEAHGLEELAASISRHGVLEPILFRRHQDGNLIVVAGERRIAAARKAGLSSVPAMYVDGNSSEIA